MSKVIFSIFVLWPFFQTLGDSIDAVVYGIIEEQSSRFYESEVEYFNSRFAGIEHTRFKEPPYERPVDTEKYLKVLDQFFGNYINNKSVEHDFVAKVFRDSGTHYQFRIMSGWLLYRSLKDEDYLSDIIEISPASIEYLLMLDDLQLGREAFDLYIEKWLTNSSDGIEVSDENDVQIVIGRPVWSVGSLYFKRPEHKQLLNMFIEKFNVGYGVVGGAEEDLELIRGLLQ